jgi:hypothetical protein
MFLGFGGYDSFAFGDYEDLFGCVGVEFVAGACKLDVDDLRFLGLVLLFQEQTDCFKY